jgi:hypothetical protein
LLPKVVRSVGPLQGGGPVSREEELVELMNDQIARAAYLLNMEDVPADADEDFWSIVHEERYHCGVCTVNTVLETIWPAFYAYIKHVRCPGFGPLPFDP